MEHTEDPASARILARDGNVAVVHLPGRAFPGLHIAADTFDALRHQVDLAAGQLRHGTGDTAEALDELDDAVKSMTEMLRCYEAALTDRGIRLPYFRDDPA